MEFLHTQIKFALCRGKETSWIYFLSIVYSILIHRTSEWQKLVGVYTELLPHNTRHATHSINEQTGDIFQRTERKVVATEYICRADDEAGLSMAALSLLNLKSTMPFRGCTPSEYLMLHYSGGGDAQRQRCGGSLFAMCIFTRRLLFADGALDAKLPPRQPREVDQNFYFAPPCRRNW